MNPCTPEYMEADAFAQFLSSVAQSFEFKKVRANYWATLGPNDNLVMVVIMKSIDPPNQKVLRLHVQMEMRIVDGDEDAGEAWKKG